MAGYGVCSGVAVFGDSVWSETDNSFGVDMPAHPTPNNLGISRQLALTVAFVGVCITIIALVIGVAFAHIDAGAILTLVATLGTLSAALIGTMKATEAADTA